MRSHSPSRSYLSRRDLSSVLAGCEKGSLEQNLVRETHFVDEYVVRVVLLPCFAGFGDAFGDDFVVDTARLAV